MPPHICPALAGAFAAVAAGACAQPEVTIRVRAQTKPMLKIALRIMGRPSLSEVRAARLKEESGTVG